MAGLFSCRWLRPAGALRGGEPRTGKTLLPMVSAPRGRGIAWAIIFMIVAVSGASAEDLSGRRSGGLAPRVVFFNNYFLIAAGEEVMTMAVVERIALGKLLE